MTNEYYSLIMGSLLHDIGKVIFRTGEGKNHSQSGYEYLKDEVGIDRVPGGNSILESVLYHHGKLLKNAPITDDSMAYITYIADNIASAADRREASEPESGFDAGTPLESIFNHLNGNDQKYYYAPKTLEKNSGINFPAAEKRAFTHGQYSLIKTQITDALKAGIDWNNDYINSLLEILEATMSYIPSSTSKKEVADISLYEHLKITAAVSSCIYMYFQSKGVSDYRQQLFKNADEFYKTNAFLLYSIDISGIQSFIYTITSKGALRTLRARSFYLEIFMENLIDEILSDVGVSRANLIYCGGGHMYALLPNIPEVIAKLNVCEKKVNKWLLKNFKTSLYVASGYASCSAMDLQNKPSGQYKAIYRRIGEMISAKKMSRYSAEEILELNNGKISADGRECRICKTVGKTDDEGLCEICSNIKKLSNDILYKDFFIVISENCEGAVPLMENRWLIAESGDDLKKRIEKNDPSYIRAFAKNAFYSGKNIASKLWVGDYTSGQSMEEFGQEADGINRVGVLRMDVDNLGQAFVSGFEDSKNDNRYVTLSRTATFSRQMTIFFKYHINALLTKPECTKLDNVSGERKSRSVSIVYSGGDDIFLLGAWDEVIEAAVDIRNSFRIYSQNMLTISGGIGLYSSSFPVHVMAGEVGELEDTAKRDKKNAVVLFEDAGRYEWDIFEGKVLDEKYLTLRKFFDNNEERGKNFLYNLLELIRNRDKKINFARYVYLLSRMEPGENAPAEVRAAYKDFSKKMYLWIKSDEDSRQLTTAIYLYAYHVRKKEEEQ